jgi:AMIN domain
MRVRVLPTLLVTTALAASSLAGITATGAAGADASANASVVPAHHWSKKPRSVTRSPSPAPEVTSIRVGQHPKFDRIVIDLDGKAAGYSIRYVKNAHRDPSGKVVHLLGPRTLLIVLSPANGHDINTGDPTLTTPRRVKWRFDEVRETAVIGDFEAVFSVGVGLAHKTPFRVHTLHNPTRIVVDVHH